MSSRSTDPDDLRPANPDDVTKAISFALRYDGGRRRVHHADTTMARVTADLLVRHLLAGGMKKDGAVAPPPRTCRSRTDRDYRRPRRPTGTGHHARVNFWALTQC